MEDSELNGDKHSPNLVCSQSLHAYNFDLLVLFSTSFEYLGTFIHQNGKIEEEEVLNRVRKTNNIYYQLNQTIFGKKEDQITSVSNSDGT
jgi:hypothetical protein